MNWIFQYLDYRVVSLSPSFQEFIECIQDRLFLSSNLFMSRLIVYWDGCNNSNLSISRLNSIRGTSKAVYGMLSFLDALIQNTLGILNYKYNVIPSLKKLQLVNI